jgi:hypothetical protein
MPITAGAAIPVSYFTARKYYYVKRELPAGRGFADIAFIPRKEGEILLVGINYNKKTGKYTCRMERT